MGHSNAAVRYPHLEKKTPTDEDTEGEDAKGEDAKGVRRHVELAREAASLAFHGGGRTPQSKIAHRDDRSNE